MKAYRIGSWDSAVATEHGIRRLPSLWLYEGDRRVSTDTRDIVARLQTRIAR